MEASVGDEQQKIGGRRMWRTRWRLVSGTNSRRLVGEGCGGPDGG